MGTLIPSSGRILQYGQRGKLILRNGAEPERKIPGLNQPVVAYTDTDGKNKWVGVDTDEYGGVLYGGKRFANANDLVSTLLTPVTPTPAPTVTKTPTTTVTTPTTVKPVTAQVVTPGGSLRHSAGAQTITNYAGKALTGVGAAFVNVAGGVAGLAEKWQQGRSRALDNITDTAAQRYLQADDAQKDKALKEYQNALSMTNTARRQSESAKNAKESLYGVSDKLAGVSENFQAAAEKNLPDVPLLKGALNTVTNLAPFFALNAIPYAGQVAAGAYLVGESTGDARRAGLSEQSQAALGLASLLSMGAAGQVGKALGGKEVTQWFLDKGLGPELARVLEQAAVSGLATGAARQTVMTGGQMYAHAEQIRTAKANLAELSKMDVSRLTPDEKAAYDSAVTANQTVISSGGVDLTGFVAGIALEMAISIGATAITYRYGPNFQTSESDKNKPIRPEESEYFKGVRTPEEAKARLRELARKYHPDISDNPDTTGIMQKINDEYDRLILDAKKVTETWRKAKAGGVTKAEADAANNAIAGLLQTARASGDAETVTALEHILAPLAAEINAAPVVPEIPLAPETPVGVTNAPVTLAPSAPEVPTPVGVPNAIETASPVPVGVTNAPITPTPTQIPAAVTNAPAVPQGPDAAANLPAFAPVPERKPFITFEEWRKQNPDFIASADAAAKAELSALTAESPAPTPQPAAPISPKPETKSAPVAETPAPVTQSAAPQSGPLRELIDGLNASDRVEIGNVRFEIIRGRDYAVAQIRRIDPQETPYIKNAANDIWRDFLPTPDAARDALISIARNLPSFAVDNPPPSGYAVGQTDAQSVPTNPEEVTVNDGQRTLADVPDGEGVRQSPVLRDVVAGLDGALEAERGQAPEGTGNARGVYDAGGGGHHGVSGGQLQHAGTVGRTGNHEGEVLRGAGAGRGQALGNRGVLSDPDAPTQADGNGLTETPPQPSAPTPTQSNEPTPPQPSAPTPETENPDAPEVRTPQAETPETSTQPETPSPGGTPETASPKPSKKTARKKPESVKTDAKPPETNVKTDQSPTPETRKTDQSPTPEARMEKQIEEKTERSAAPKGKDFTFPEGGLQLPNGAKSRARANLAAVEILRRLESEGRPATAEEQDALSKFVGWGGLSDIFDKRKSEWETLRGQLKEALSDEEYAAAEHSTMNAHYTSAEVIKGIYAALEHIGFTGGRVLEPSAGIGHFNGAMPANLRGKSRWTMIELDPITGGIAKALYPNADVRVQGFEDSLLPDNYYDAAISNVPFGDLRVVDKNYPSFITHSIHNFFFAKALDKVRPGGIVAFITSRYTMDSYQSDVRKWLSGKADLLGAVRLPDTAFKANAGTDVVADILILRKRAPDTPYAGEKFAETNYRAFQSRDGWVNGYVNQYFEKHPEMVLGVMDKGGMYRGDSLTWKPKDSAKSLTEQIAEAFATVTERMSYPARRTQEDIRAEIRADAAKGKVGGLVKRDGKIYRNADGKLVEATDIPKTQRPKLEAILSMRDGARALLDFQASGAPDEQIDNSRKGLNAMYDDFVKRYGPLHENRSVVMRDADGPFILSLEKYDKDTKTATKADIFTKNTITPNVTATHADSVEDALTICLNETGAVSAERIAELTGNAPETITKSLLESGLAFLNRDGNLETAEQYLSGNVRAKLRDAKALAEGNPAYRRNVEALEKIIPPDIQAEDIKAQIGATWVPDEVYSVFAEEMTRQYGSITVTYNKNLGEYRVEPSRNAKQTLKTSALNTTKWGTPDKTFLEIFAATLNNKDLNVWRKKSDGSRILDQDATAAVKQKAKEIQAEFQDWLFRKPERREVLTRLYNDVHNNSVTPRYDGSKLEINGMNTNVTLNPHQKNAVWRIINSGGNTLLAHRVGAGKTYEMAAAAMKLRQLGVVKKPMFVVPKSLTGQWAREFLDLFPNAKILAPGDDFSAANRKEYVNRIATGDYDAVILSYEQFKAIPMSAESRAGFIREQISRLEAALEEESRNHNTRSPSVKQMAKKKANLEAELKKLMDKKEDADNINFEALGADSIFVDEAHNMKNLFYTTHMNNVTGLGNKEGSQQAFDLYMKTRYLQQLNGGRGVVFATATPVMNSVVEMYTMQTYLQPDALAARGIYNFDAWANQFAEVRTELQISPSGQGGRMKDTLSRYNNLQALQQMFSQFMDVVTEIPNLKIPKMEGGKRIVVECEASERQREEMRTLAKRAEDLKSRRIDPKVDNILKIGTDGRKLSYSQHMIDLSLPYEPDGKIMKCAENVARVWKETADRKGTQIIFCDYFTPQSGAAATAKGAEAELSKAEAALEAQAEKEAVTLYQDMKNILIGMGVPAREIAFIHDAKNVEQRNQLFDKMRAGKVRVLIGSTGKMGVGMNVQDRAVALHHLDAPQRPGDVEQREGRVLRQGNLNDEVAIYTYITKNTFDARAWDILQRKWTFIVQLTSGDFTGNSFEGDSDVLSAAEIKAIASGNPLIQEQFQLTADIATLEGLERAHRRETFAAQDRLKAARAAIAADTDTAARLRADIATRRDTSGKAFAVALDGKTVTERKAAGEQLIKLAQKFLKPGQSPETTKKIGTFAGFDLLTSSGGDLILRGRGQYRASVNFASAVGTVQTLEAAAKRLDNTLSDVENRLTANRDAVPELEKASSAPFAKAAELEQKRKRQAEILVELSDDRKPSGNVGEDAVKADAGSASGTPQADAEAVTPKTDAFRETASGTPEASALKEAAPAWEITEDENGVLRFRDTAAAKDKADSGGKSAKAATMGNHAERWTAERVGDADAKPGRIAEIIRKYSQGWSRHVTVGHVRGARGQYQRQGSGIGSGGIRLKQANDLPVFIHELGHAIDDGYQLTEKLRNLKSGLKVGSLENPLSKEEASERVQTMRLRMDVAKELKSNLDPQFAAQYKDDQLLSEGMAEFFRRFCQNRVTAAADYPETYRYVMTTLSGADQARLLAMADEVNAVYALDAETAQSSIRHMDDKAVDYRTKAERFSNALDKLIQKTVDSLYPVKKLSQMMGSDVHKKFYNAAYADSMAHFILTNDLRDLDGQYKGPGLRTVLSRISVNDAKEFDAFGEYLVVRNAPSWIADDKRVLADDRKNNLYYCQLREKKLEQKYPQFKAASEALYKFWDQFMDIYVVKTGLISQEQYDAMRAKHPYYVPFRRVMEDVIAASKGFGTHRTFANQPNPIKKAIGSGRDIIHPVESMISSIAKFVYQGVHQRCMLELIDTANAYGLDAAFMERVPAPLSRQIADISGVKAEIAERVTNSDLPEKDVELLLSILEEQGDMMSWYVPRQLLPENCIGVRRNGEVEVYKINDPLLFDALANMGRPYLEKELTKKANQLTRFVSSMITGWNITWSLFSNGPRDLVTALVYSTPENRLKLIPKIAGSWLDAVNQARGLPNVNPYYLEYLALGGGDSSAWAMDTKLPKKILSEMQGPTDAKQRVLTALTAPLKWIEFVSRTTEAGPRVATYELCREAGMEPQAAFRAAMEITVDFRKGGWLSRHLNVLMPFANASGQGTYKDMSALTGADVPKKDRAKVVRGRLIAFLAASLIGAAIEYALNNVTEERRKSYQRLSTYTKNSYFCIPTGDGKYWAIPKNRGIAIPLNFFRAAMERTIGGNRHAYDGFWGYAATAEFPNGLSDIITLNPSSFFGTVTILGPMAQIWANADFRGMPIESAKDRKLSPRERYTGSTSALAKNLGAALNLSPKQIDFLGNNTLGAAWQYQRALFPVDASKRDLTLGVQGKYVKDSLYSQDSVNRLYDLAEKSSRDSMDDVTDVDSKVTAYFDSAMTTFYSRYNSIARSEDDSGPEDRVTRELVLTLIEDYLAAREDGTLTAEQNAVYAVCRAAGDTERMLPSARQNTVKDGDGTVHNLTAAQYYDYQGNFNSVYWNLVKEALPQVRTDAEKEAVLKSALDAAGEMAKNNALIKMGAATTKEYKRYEDLQLYSVPISTYLVAAARTKDIEGLKDKRTGETISNSKGALIAEAVREMELDLPETNLRMLMDKLDVGETVLDWNERKLARKLREFRKDAGVE